MKTCLALLLVSPFISLIAAPIQPVSYRVPAKMPDAAEALSPGEVQLKGMLGERVLNNEKNRLVKVDLEPLLAGFRKKPGTHPWIGEHIGKWLHASTLAWAYTGDPALRAKMDYAVAELIKSQEPDGYLGTYVPGKRFGLFAGADWDVWSHKYNLIGLLTYYQFTGNEEALKAARKIGDLLVSTFGEGKKSILSAGTHMGMAATSVLEPIVLLYRDTGDERYLAFAKYIVRAWDEPNGPKIIAILLKEKSVQKTANAKAYEMLSNLVGLCELARATGERRYLEPALIAWEDIVAHRLYITGGASQGEHFHDDYELPNDMRASVSEGCVIATWIQLNLQLLRLTGEARFGDQLEKTFVNHMAAAQRPDGAQWCYFTALEGTKPYGPGINCCVSSGPRGMALVPQATWLKIPARGGAKEALALDLFESSSANTRIDGQAVTISFQSRFPMEGQAQLTIHTEEPAAFGIQIRTPAWAQPLKVISTKVRTVPSGSGIAKIPDSIFTAEKGGWTILSSRPWMDGDSITLTYTLSSKLVRGEHGNLGKAALTWGPFVMAYDTAQNADRPAPAMLGFADDGAQQMPGLASAKNYPLLLQANLRSSREKDPKPALFVPFAEAGRDGSRYQIWLSGPGAELPKNESLTAFAQDSRSRAGNLIASITDGDPSSLVVTFDNKKADEDWFAVQLDAPAEVRRIVFVHGKNFHDGGWFDSSAGKPRVQVKRDKNGAWETIGQLDTYPATSAIDSAGLQDGQSFTLRLANAEKVVALRVIGKPSCGDNPRQAFSSCAELQAFEQ